MTSTSQPENTLPERKLSNAASFILSRALESVDKLMTDDPTEDDSGDLTNAYARINGLLQRGSGDAHLIIKRWDVIRKATEEYERINQSQ